MTGKEVCSELRERIFKETVPRYSIR